MMTIEQQQLIQDLQNCFPSHPLNLAISTSPIPTIPFWMCQQPTTKTTCKVSLAPSHPTPIRTPGTILCTLVMRLR